MKRDVLQESQEQLLLREGDALREMMKTDGWKVMYQLFKTTVEMYDSTHGLKTLREMLARQDSIAMMNAWMEHIVQRVSNLEHKETVSRDMRARMSASGLVTIPE